MNDAASDQTVPPVDKTIRVRASQARAFEAFTAEINDWWPLAKHSIESENAVALVLEPKTGGAIYQTMADGSTIPWGRVETFDPPSRLVLSWHIGVPPEQASRVEITFKEAGDGMTEVRLIHSGFEAMAPDEAASVRNHYDAGWVSVFETSYAGFF